MLTDRLPPQDIETETACLGSALLSREALYKITEILQAEDFYLENHRIIFKAILDLEKKNLPIDLTTLRQKLIDLDQFERIGGNKTLASVYQTVSTTAYSEAYANRVKELSLRRKLIEVASESVEKCYDRSIETSDLLDEIERNIFLVTEKRVTSDFKTIETVLADTMQDVEYWYDTKKVVTGISSGYTDLDEMLTGFHESELIIIAARPAMGKTSFALNIMNNIALKESKPALFFSLEMPATQLAMRMLCVEAMVDSQRVRTGHINQEEMKKLYNTSSVLARSPVYIDDTPSMNILEMRAKCRRMAQKHKLGAVIVDYLQLITSPSRVDRHLQIAEISRLLKQLARELSVPVIALSQLSRAVESRSDQMPTLSDLRESGSIEQDADVVMFIYREEKVKKDTERKGIADIVVAKQRNGPIGTISLKFWEKYTKFDNLAMVQPYDEMGPPDEF